MKKITEPDKKTKILIAGAALLIIFLIFIVSLDIKKKINYQRVLAQYNEMLVLEKEFLKLKTQTGMVEDRIGLSVHENLSIVMERLISTIGVRDKMKNIKPFEAGQNKGYSIQQAEVLFDGIDLNELVNLFYAIYTTPKGLFVTSFNIKKDFSKKQRIDARLSVKLVGLKQGAPQ